MSIEIDLYAERLVDGRWVLAEPWVPNSWLLPEFRAWSIEDEIDAIRCPLLAVQGVDDEYGTLEQVRGIARRLPQAEIAEFENCGHSPQRDQPERLIEVSCRFIERNTIAGNADQTGFYAQS